MPQKNAPPPEMPLAGIRVLDFGQFIAGPVCAALLADLGADVIRIERLGGNPDRMVSPLHPDTPDIGGLFTAANRNKRSLAIDLKRPDAREIVEKLIQTADGVVTNMTQRALTKMGLDTETLKRLNPKIVVSNVTAYGTVGPWADRAGFDGMVQAMSGAMHLSGDGQSPRKSYVHFVDYYAGAIAAVGLLASLLGNRNGRLGGSVETSLLGSSMMMMNTALAEEAVLQLGRTGQCNRAQAGGPADTFDTRDGSIILQVLGNPKFKLLAQLLGDESLADDPRFATDGLRGDNGEALNVIVQQWCLTKTSDECVEALSKAGLCAAPVLTPSQALVHPQVKDNPTLHQVPYADGQIQVPTFLPMAVDGHRSSAPAPAPRLGSHSREVLTELGYSSSAIDGLVEGGLVSTGAAD